MFGPSIEKAKRLALIDLRECMASTGILQTQSFYPPEVYVEYVDSIFRVVWLTLYRDYLETIGLNQTLSHGRLVAITSKMSMPNRVYELAIHTLSPVILKTEIFIPSIELLKCRSYDNLTSKTFLFGSTLGTIDPLAARYGITLRTGFLHLMKNLPGAMTFVTPLKSSEVYFVLRTVLFRKRKNNDNINFNKKIDMTIELSPERKADVIETTDASLKGQPYVTRCSRLVNDLFPEGAADIDVISDHKWFIPYVYSRIQEEINLVNALSTYLPLVVYTGENIEVNGINRETLDVDIDQEDTFLSVFTNSLNSNFGPGIMQSIKSLRIKEARLAPRFETGAEVFGILRLMILKAWKDVSFPALDSIFTFTQPDWKLPSTSPLFPYQIRWTRQVRQEAQRIPKPGAGKETQLNENLHEAKIT